MVYHVLNSDREDERQDWRSRPSEVFRRYGMAASNTTVIAPVPNIGFLTFYGTWTGTINARMGGMTLARDIKPGKQIPAPTTGLLELDFGTNASGNISAAACTGDLMIQWDPRPTAIVTAGNEGTQV